MTKRNIWMLFLAGALFFTLGRINSAQQAVPTRDTAAQAQSQEKAKTFTGKIAQSEGKYVLQDSSGTVYNLDDQDKAKQFDGQNVKVVGILDGQSKTIHVSEIEAA